jgi:hypothetical protein
MHPLLGLHDAEVEGDALRKLAERVCCLARVDRAYLIRVQPCTSVLDCEFEYCVSPDVPPFQPTFRNVRNRCVRVFVWFLSGVLARARVASVRVDI